VSVNACVEHELVRVGEAMPDRRNLAFRCREGKRQCDKIAVPVISVKQPWAWLIANGHQDILSRDSDTAVRGVVLVHAASGWDKRDFDIAADLAWAMQVDGMPLPQELNFGGIVGVAKVSDCVQRSDSLWFTGQYGIVFEQARMVPFMPLQAAAVGSKGGRMFKADMSREQAFRLGLIT